MNLYGIPVAEVKAAVLVEMSEKEEGSLVKIKVWIFSGCRYMYVALVPSIEIH